MANGNQWIQTTLEHNLTLLLTLARLSQPKSIEKGCHQKTFCPSEQSTHISGTGTTKGKMVSERLLFLLVVK
jgi:hypothetical protein